MAQTALMRAEVVQVGFNSVEDRSYWIARLAGNRINPEVHFNSRASMVQVSYRINTNDFTLTFSKTSAAFGDYMASAMRSMSQILAALKAAGLPFAEAMDAGQMWTMFDPRTKVITVGLTKHGDTWGDIEPMLFKVPERKPIDAITLDPLL